jgi:hypothetical protein
MILNFTIHRANDLPVADVCFTDGYVIVRLNGKIIFRTRTFYKSLNPIWNEFSFVDIPSRQNSILRFEIYDTDEGKDDDLIGFHEVNLLSIPFNEPEKERRCPITNVGEYHGSSSIVISLLLQRDQILQFPADDSLAPEEMMLISKAFQSKWIDRPMKSQSEFHLFLVQIDFIWNFIISDIDEYLKENKLAHLKYLLECFYTELLDSFYALKSSLQVLPQSSATTRSHVTSFPSNSANSSRESQFRELIFYLFRNNRKFLSILQSKSSFFLNSLSSEQKDSLLLSYYLDYSKLLEEYQYVLLWKINYFISLRNLNPSQEFLERNILQELQTIYQEFIQLYNEFKDNQCDLYPMEMNVLSDFFHSFPLMYSTLLLQFAEHLKNRSNCQNINTNTNTSSNHVNVNVKNDSWYCSLLNICSFILESSEWKFSAFSFLPSSIESSSIQEQYERSIPEVIHRYQLLHEDALHQLSNIIINLIYSQFVANINEHPLTSSSSSSTTTTTSRTSSQTLFNFSSPNLYLAYQQKILSNGHMFQLFSHSLMKEILLNKRFDSLRMWGASLKSTKQFQSLQLEIINKFFSIFYQLLSSCYDFYSKEFIHYQKCNENKSLLPSFSNWIIDQEILYSLASDMNDCLDLLSSKYFIDPEKKKMMMMKHPSIQMIQMIVNLLLTSEEYFNRADKMKDIFKQAREVLAGAPDYTKERIQQVLKICFALKGYYFYFNQVPSLFSMNLHDFFLSRTDVESISSHSSSSSSVEQERHSISIGRGKSLFQSVSSLFRLSRRIDSSSPGIDTTRRERSYLVHPNVTNVTAIETVIVEMDQFSDFFPTISSPHTVPRDSEGSIPRIDAFMLMFPSEEYLAILRESFQCRSSSGSSCYSFEEELLSSPGYFTLFQSLSEKYYSNSFLTHPPPSGSSTRRIVKIDQLKVFNLLYCAPPVGPTILMEGEAPKPSIHFELIPYSSALLSSSSSSSSSYSDATSSFKTEDTNIRVQKLSAWDQESLLLSIPSATETVQLLSLEMELKYQTTSQGIITVGRCAFPMVSYLLKPFLRDRDRDRDRGSSNHFYSFQEPAASSSLSVLRMVSRAYSDAQHEERPFPCLGFSLSAV